jgi:2-phospho-L-lactate guanylyltransferase
VNAGLIPVKRLDSAKQRLGPRLSHAQRADVARALFDDAMNLARQTDFLTWWVVSDDDDVLNEAAGRGLGVVKDPGEGLNEALRRAIEEIAGEGATSVAIVPADVPLAWKGDLQDLVDTGATSEVVIVPSSRDGGTNALWLSPPGLLEPQFGERSLHAHLRLAARLELRCTILDLPRLALDIDTIDDVESLLGQAKHPSRTVDVVRGLHLDAGAG